MTANDLALFAPVIAAILLAAAILVVDFIAPGRFVPAILVTFMGLTVVGFITVATGQIAAADPSSTKKSVYIQPRSLIFQSQSATNRDCTRLISAGQATDFEMPTARDSGNQNTLKP